MGIKLKIYSHHFQVTGVDALANQAIETFSMRLVQRHIERDAYGNIVVKAVYVYATRSYVDQQYRFHITLLDEFKQFMFDKNISIDSETIVPLYQPTFADIKMKDGWTPREDQIPVIDYLIADGYKKVVDAHTGSGKELCNGTPVKTPNGWTNIEDLKIGDLVMGERGEYHKVNGVFPQGKKDLYKFTFKDGRTAIAGAEHLWHIKKQVGEEVMSTLELIEYRNKNITNFNRTYIPLVDNVVEQPDVELPIDPYVLGVILGDGSITGNGVCISKPNIELHDKIRDICEKNDIFVFTTKGYRNYESSKGAIKQFYINSRLSKGNASGKDFYQDLTDLGLMGAYSHTKFIPEIYLNAGTKQRLALLQGLLDSDGYADGIKNGIEYGTVSERLAEEVKQLLWSLGAMVHVRIKKPTYTYRGEKRVGKPYYRLSIRYRRPNELFSLSVKKDKLRNETQYSKGFALRIENIEKLDHQEECTCISVDNPTKLFVIKDYIVTHNTVMTLFALAEIKQRVAMVIKPMYIERWLDVFYGKDVALDNVSVKDVMIVQGSKNLRSLFYLAQDGLLNSKIIVISNRTLAQYYQYYKENGADDFYANVKPEEMWELLGIGVRLIDEAHQEFHSGFMCDLHTHVPKSIELSGTLNPDDQFLKRMYEIMYPIHLRANTGIMTKYIDIVGLIYGLSDDPKPVKTQRRGKTYYSQAAYEESIFKQPKRMDRLKQMLAELVEELFVAVKLPEHKLLMFFETVDMCTAVADHLKQLYPEYKVSRYTQEEPASTLEENDIIVATPRSAGTAVDISKLQITISFVMRSSSQELQQMVGRLRQLKTDKVNPTYYYLYTTQIPTHNVYSKKLNEVFKLKANSRIERHINYEL